VVEIKEETLIVKCPHCLTDFHDQKTETALNQVYAPQLTERDGAQWMAIARICPACGQAIIDLRRRKMVATGSGVSVAQDSEIRAWPKGVARAPLSTHVPQKYASDYREACLVMRDSPKASAALSRRCLQLLLRDEAKVKPGNLSVEIDQALASKMFPASIAGAVDGIRQIGNFAAHPMKSTNSGEIIEVEDGEAEWCLDVLESLFDFYFVQPKVLAEKKAALNKKLTDAGKNPMK
jgi:Domain of unknown function (DUF4145)